MSVRIKGTVCVSCGSRTVIVDVCGSGSMSRSLSHPPTGPLIVIFCLFLPGCFQVTFAQTTLLAYSGCVILTLSCSRRSWSLEGGGIGFPTISEGIGTTSVGCEHEPA